jgi:integrase
MSVRFHHSSFLAEWYDEHGDHKAKAFVIEPDAIQFEKKMRRDVHAKRRAMKADPASAVGKVGDLCDVWAEGQKYWYAKRVARDVKVKLGSLRIFELTPPAVNSMLDHWQEAGLAPNTRTNFGHTWKRLLRWFESLPGAPHDLSKFVRRIKPYQPRQEMLTVREEDALLRLSAGKPWLNCWLRIFLCLGLRMSEVCSLSPYHYDRETKMVTNVRAKGDILRMIAVPPELQEIFEPLMTDPESRVPFIDALKGIPLTFANIRWHFNDLKKKAGVPRQKRPHDMRATAITTFFVTNGNDLIATQRFAGHKYAGSTQPYIRHLNDAALAPMIERARIIRFKDLRTAKIAAQKKTG